VAEESFYQCWVGALVAL
jgi:hypothetical protein